MEATATAITETEKSERPNWDALEEWQRQFLLRYYEHWNGTKAYKQTRPDVKHDTARTDSSRLLAKANVIAAMRETLDDIGIAAPRIKAAQAQMALGNDIADFAEILNNPDADLAELRDRGVPTKLIRRFKRRRRVQTNNQGEEIVTTDVEIEPYNAQGSLDALQRIAGLDKSADGGTGGAVLLDIKVITVQGPALPAKAVESVVQTALTPEQAPALELVALTPEPDDHPSAPTDATVDIVAHQPAPPEAPTDG